MRSAQGLLGFLLFSLLILGVPALSSEQLKVKEDHLHLKVSSESYEFTFSKKEFNLVIKSAHSKKLLLETSKHAPLFVSRWLGESFQSFIYEGYSFRLGAHLRTFPATSVDSWSLSPSGEHISVLVKTTRDDTVIVVDLDQVSPKRLSLGARLLSSGKHINRVGWGFKWASKKEGLFGFGERFVPQQNKRGMHFSTWVEDGGWGFGTELRLPKGAMSTYIPIPFSLSSASGYGLFLNTTFRSEYDLRGKHAYSFEVEADHFSSNIYFGDSPADSLALYTGEGGRSLIPPKFMFGPWNQFGGEFAHTSSNEWPHDGGVDAWRQFIELDIPSSFAVNTPHYFPMGSAKRDEAKLRNVTIAYEELGLPTQVYFNPMVDLRYKEAYNEASANGYFIKNADGSNYAYAYKGAGRDPFYVSAVDFTNPEAKEWYKG